MNDASSLFIIKVNLNLILEMSIKSITSGQEKLNVINTISNHHVVFAFVLN